MLKSDTLNTAHVTLCDPETHFTARLCVRVCLSECVCKRKSQRENETGSLRCQSGPGLPQEHRSLPQGGTLISGGAYMMQQILNPKQNKACIKIDRML